MLREVSQRGSKTCASHRYPASLKVCGATRFFLNMGCDKIMNRMPKADCGPELQQKGQDSNGGGTSVSWPTDDSHGGCCFLSEL